MTYRLFSAKVTCVEDLKKKGMIPPKIRFWIDKDSVKYVEGSGIEVKYPYTDLPLFDSTEEDCVLKLDLARICTGDVIYFLEEQNVKKPQYWNCVDYAASLKALKKNSSEFLAKQLNKQFKAPPVSVQKSVPSAPNFDADDMRDLKKAIALLHNKLDDIRDLILNDRKNSKEEDSVKHSESRIGDYI